MKVIDLLNKIANGEEVPKKIRIKGYDREFYFDGDIYQYKAFDGIEYAMTDDISIEMKLNDEVEIIEDKEMCHKCHKYPAEYNQTYCEFCLGISEEDKKIRKIKVDYSPDIEEKIFYEDGDKPRHCVLGDAGTELLINKINEIIDKINGGTND